MAVPRPHLCVPVLTVEGGGEWAEGEKTRESKVPHPELAFKAALFLPSPNEESTGRGSRQVKRPTLLIDARRMPDPDLGREDQLDITAPKLTGPDPVRWQLEGDPQPAGRPGRRPRVYVANLIRVEE